jgi:hypothetical protein
MWGWEMTVDGVAESGRHEYPEENILGQAAMTEAMFNWLSDDSNLHPLCLKNLLRDFNVILWIYASALRREVVDLSCEPRLGLILALRDALGTTPDAFGEY